MEACSLAKVVLRGTQYGNKHWFECSPTLALLRLHVRPLNRCVGVRVRSCRVPRASSSLLAMLAVVAARRRSPREGKFAAHT